MLNVLFYSQIKIIYRFKSQCFLKVAKNQHRVKVSNLKCLWLTKYKMHLKKNHSPLGNHAYYMNEKQKKYSLRLSVFAVNYVFSMYFNSNNPSSFLDYF